MQIANLYIIDGSVDSNGKYKTDRNVHTIIAECTQKDVDHGCYYFAFLTYSKVNNESLNYSFIEIPNLLTFLSDNSIANFRKVKFSEPTKKIYESYLNEVYEAKNKVHKIGIVPNSPENIIWDKQK